MGDSAGGNLCLGVLNLAIQKKCWIPDGLHLIYPAIVVSKTHFAPSYLLCLDDSVLSMSFLALVLECYVSKDFDNHSHYLLSPLFTPMEMLKQYPRIRMSIAGLDPLRDDAINFTSRLAKAGVDLLTVEYQYLMHAYQGQAEKNNGVEEAIKALERSVCFLKELAQPDPADC
mmetsp:Transcript_9943/g.11166  ORF Transcript_9943/g.11166 Transcript_9943/m.11166 type:complete len:172 (-) Transcript_9943:6-521(-)